MDGERIRRETFTIEEYKKFTDAMRSMCSKQNLKNLEKEEQFENS